jgi:transposase
MESVSVFSMTQKTISPRHIKGLIIQHAIHGASATLIARSYKIARSTVRAYIELYNNSDFVHVDILNLSANNIAASLRPQNSIYKNAKYRILRDRFLQYHQRLKSENTNMKTLWEEYNQKEPSGLKYSRFVDHYHMWRKENGFSEVNFNKWQIRNIPKEDEKTLREWRLSNKRSKWERAVALLDLNREGNITKISRKIERSCKTIKKWHAAYIDKGIKYLDLPRTRRVPKQIIDNISLKKERIIKLLHESPSLHDLNRTSWSLKTLTQAYDKIYDETISKSSISEYVRSEKYTFTKARTVLTSPDPEYRTKLKEITNILSNLQSNEKFFSIDEFGPVAIKIRGGRTFSLKDQTRTIPQLQRSKGSLICTAALELSTNQITHFYSSKKNTAEMIKLLEILIEKYTTEERIYFSWDAASWHASKKLYEKVKEVNDPEYRNKHSSPFVELAPLPSSAQFLNVIESVFSGMAKAVIHNSDYQTVDECKHAINRHFSERNQAFLENPKRAGKKIWGKEIVKAVFKDSNNCKDPKYR